MRVLVAEDEPKMADLLRRGLMGAGWAVDVVENGEDAVWMGVEWSYDAIVLDVGLPDVDGFEVCRRLRARERWAPVLILTARHGVDDTITGLDCGADDYMTKPFAFDELTARLRALTRRAPQPRPPVLAAGDLRLDPATREVTRGGTPIDLSPKEFALLELLMSRTGDVLTRSEILDHVWDFAYDGTSNVVDVYIGYLRAKVDRPFDRETIETVRGVGYRLAPGTG